MVNVNLNLSSFTVFLKNKNIIFKIRRSKVTDYAALTGSILQKLSILVDWWSIEKMKGQFRFFGPHLIKLGCPFGFHFGEIH